MLFRSARDRRHMREEAIVDAEAVAEINKAEAAEAKRLPHLSEAAE